MTRKFSRRLWSGAKTIAVLTAGAWEFRSNYLIELAQLREQATRAWDEASGLISDYCRGSVGHSAAAAPLRRCRWLEVHGFGLERFWRIRAISQSGSQRRQNGRDTALVRLARIGQGTSEVMIDPRPNIERLYGSRPLGRIGRPKSRPRVGFPQRLNEPSYVCRARPRRGSKVRG